MAVLLAVLIHIVVALALVLIRPEPMPRIEPAPVTVMVHVEAPAAEPVEPVQVVEPVPLVEPEPVPPQVRVEPEPVAVLAPRETPVREPAAEAAGEPTDPASPSVSGSFNILTAEGGRTDLGLVTPQDGNALRGLFCATGSRDLRVAAGCDMLGEGAQGITGYGDNLPPDQLPRGFWLREEGPGSPQFTVNAAGLARPGQIFSQHSHFVRGAHTAFGQLPVPEKARDPGFGDLASHEAGGVGRGWFSDRSGRKARALKYAHKIYYEKYWMGQKAWERVWARLPAAAARQRTQAGLTWLRRPSSRMISMPSKAGRT
ncbi:hypothetical protein L2D00_03705 [Hyphomonadaceae bacterium BL14]|nr:hypothetical protein L2D00_03705 [Hyphomonadaceae bacterium BL14]